jgi:hypothetical protein
VVVDGCRWWSWIVASWPGDGPIMVSRGLTVRACSCNDRYVVTAIWILIASVWVIIGTRRQVELSTARLWRQERAAAETYTTVKEWMSEVPRWRVCRRRQLRREIEDIIRDDVDLWTPYQEVQKELSAWNLLESAAALAFGGSLYQLFEAVRSL